MQTKESSGVINIPVSDKFFGGLFLDARTCTFSALENWRD
jgi:hypothetical protein